MIVVSRYGNESDDEAHPEIDLVESDYIELGRLNVLTKRELEVFVMLTRTEYPEDLEDSLPKP